MICSSEKRFFTSNLLGIGNWTPNQGATQTWGDVGCLRLLCSRAKLQVQATIGRHETPQGRHRST
ncbi:hypothetical protein EYC54_22860 [Xanthomonas oryzae]|nr:hypothetical protein EYC54_22860 [Xanthomonas oryzae]